MIKSNGNAVDAIRNCVAMKSTDEAVINNLELVWRFHFWDCRTDFMSARNDGWIVQTIAEAVNNKIMNIPLLKCD